MFNVDKILESYGKYIDVIQDLLECVDIDELREYRPELVEKLVEMKLVDEESLEE